MEHLHLIDQTKALDFILAGKAIFTIENKVSGSYLTYKVKKAKKQTGDKMMFFVETRDGSVDFKFFGTIVLNLTNKQVYFKYSDRAAKFAKTEPAVVAFDHIFNQVFAQHQIRTKLNLWHKGMCCRCGKDLTTPESIQLGIGPECIKKKPLY